MIDKSTVDRIFAAADIVEIINDFVTLKRKGVNYQACCPFHNEKTPSFVVSPAKGVFKCFGCGKGGNAVSFVMEHEHMTYVEALKYVARKYGIEVQEKARTEEEVQRNNDRESMMVVSAYAQQYFIDKLHNTPEGRNIGMSYFYERGFTDATIGKFQLGYCLDKPDAFSLQALSEGYKEEFLVRTGLTIKRESGGYYDRFSGRVIFPVHSLSGRVIAFGGRTLRTDKKTAKYLNSPESEIYHKSDSLYGIFFAKKAITQENRCILVEGYTDVISMHQAGIANVVASSGTSLTEGQIKLIKRFTPNVTVLYDGDSAGIKASLRGIDMLLKEGLNVRVVLLPDGEDPDSFARSRGAAEVNAFILEHEEDFLSFKTQLLFGEVKNDPIGRANIIGEVVRSISVIPDEITRSVYIKECSRLMDMDDAVIAREVARRRIGQIDGEAGREVMRNRERKEAYQARQEGEAAAGGERSHAAALQELEKELVSYLLKYGDRNFYFYQPRQEPTPMNVADTIIGEMQADGITFVNPLYRRIYEDYLKVREEVRTQGDGEEAPAEEGKDGTASGRGISINYFINHAEPAVCDFVVDLLSQEDAYRPSRIWTKQDVAVATEADNLGVAVPKAISLYKLQVIDSIIDNLKAELAESGDMEILRRMNALNKSRIAICHKYSRIIM